MNANYQYPRSHTRESCVGNARRQNVKIFKNLRTMLLDVNMNSTE